MDEVKGGGPPVLRIEEGDENSAGAEGRLPSLSPQAELNKSLPSAIKIDVRMGVLQQNHSLQSVHVFLPLAPPPYRWYLW